MTETTMTGTIGADRLRPGTAGDSSRGQQGLGGQARVRSGRGQTGRGKGSLPRGQKVRSGSERTFVILNTALLVVFSLAIVVPVWNVFISSFASSEDLANGFGLFPHRLTLINYQQILNNDIWQALFISVSKTVVGALTHVLFCAVVAYALAKRTLRGRKLYSAMGIITMFFGGGLIPTYLLIKSLGLVDTFWVYIIPGLFSYFDVIILFNFFRAIPESLEESAKIDGAGDFRIFWSIFLPLSKPALTTIALFNGVGQWNDFMTALIYINNKALQPLQMLIYNIVAQAQIAAQGGFNPAEQALSSTQGMQLATIVVTALPILVAYPFLQRYFIGGIMIGAVKE